MKKIRLKRFKNKRKDQVLLKILAVLFFALLLLTVKKWKSVFIKEEPFREIFEEEMIQSLEGEEGETEPEDIYADGVHKAYHPNGTLRAVFEIKKGKMEGTRKVFSEYGRLLEEENYLGGNYHGAVKSYRMDGSLKSVLNFINGKKEGASLYYYPRGPLRSEENYKEGLLEGVTKFYYQTGALMSLINFKVGNPLDRNQYHPNGALWRQDSYSHKKLHGISRFYNDKGVLLAEVTFHLGQAVGLKKFDSGGKVAAEIAQPDQIPQQDTALVELIRA